jgi:hypothetical protein
MAEDYDVVLGDEPIRYNYQRGFSYEMSGAGGSDGFFTVDMTVLNKMIADWDRKSSSGIVQDIMDIAIEMFAQNILVPQLQEYAPYDASQGADGHLRDSFEVEPEGLGVSITMNGRQAEATLTGRRSIALVSNDGKKHVMSFIGQITGERIYVTMVNAAITGETTINPGSASSEGTYDTALDRHAEVGGSYTEKQGHTPDARMHWLERATDSFRRHGYYGSLARLLAEASVDYIQGDGSPSQLQGLVSKTALLARVKDYDLGD